MPLLIANAESVMEGSSAWESAHAAASSFEDMTPSSEWLVGINCVLR